MIVFFKIITPSKIFKMIVWSCLLFARASVFSQGQPVEPSSFTCLNSNFNEKRPITYSNYDSYFVLTHSSKNGNIHYLLEINENRTDTLFALNDINNPYSFCIDSRRKNLYALYGDYFINFSLEEGIDPIIINLEIGQSSQIELIKDTLLTVTNYFLDGKVGKPKIEVFHANSLELLYIDQFKTLSYGAFYLAISPYQKKQTRPFRNGLLFIDYITGSLEFFDVNTRKKSILIPIKQDPIFDRILKLSDKYFKKSRIKTFQELENIENHYVKAHLSKINFKE